MKVTLHQITPDIEKTIVEVARVSSGRKDKSAEGEKLLRYLIRNSHWSPFEHGFTTMEIITSKAIAIQLLRHRSFTFQEFSQRYQDVSKIAEGDEGVFQPIELREQAENNRQSSSKVINPTMYDNELSNHISDSYNLYDKLLKAGVARECARMILPMCTTTKLYMTGSIRSWIHFLDLRTNNHAQKEIRKVANEIKNVLIKELPVISSALGWETVK